MNQLRGTHECSVAQHSRNIQQLSENACAQENVLSKCSNMLIKL